MDAFTSSEPAGQSVVKLVEKILLPVHDENERESGEIEEIVNEVFIIQLVDIIEGEKIVLFVVLPKPIQDDIGCCRLTVDIRCTLNLVEDPVERLERGVILPAVDVGRVDAWLVTTELVDALNHPWTSAWPNTPSSESPHSMQLRVRNP